MNRISVIQGNLSQNLRNASVLHGGSVVKGRVLAKNGDGSYSVSLAGQKINVKSETPLQSGSVFSAKVSIKGESVELSLVKENLSSEIVQKFGAASGLNAANSEIPPQIANLLSSLGFEPNPESLKILQFMQQIGMKIDVSSAKKALKQAKNSPDKEEKAQISLLLEEKGIKSSDERVSQVLGRNPNNSHEQNERKNQEKKTFLKGKKITGSLVKSYFSEVDESSLTHDAGVLTLFNTILSAPQKDVPLRHWILLPFEWNFHSYSGNIRLLFDSELKNLEKLVVDLKNPEKNHIFVLDYRDGEPDSLRFASDSAESYSVKSRLSSLLSSMFSGKVAVQMLDFDLLKGFCAEDEKFASVEGAF